MGQPPRLWELTVLLQPRRSLILPENSNSFSSCHTTTASARSNLALHNPSFFASILLPLDSLSKYPIMCTNNAFLCLPDWFFWPIVFSAKFHFPTFFLRKHVPVLR